jgi:hypothetical protein
VRGPGHAKTLALVVLALGGMLIPFTSVQGKIRLESQWRDAEHDASVDGSADDWRGAMSWVEKAGLSLGIRNDEEFLYLCLYSSNREVAHRAEAGGLIVSLGDKLTIRFPTGRPGPGGPASDPPGRGRLRERGPDRADVLVLTHKMTDTPLRLPLDNELGVEVRMALEPDFVYELKVPVVRTALLPYAVEAEPGDTITVRIDSASSEGPGRDGPPGGRGVGGPGGGMPGGGMPGGGRPGGMPGGGGSGMGRGGRGGGPPGGMDGGSDLPEPIHIKAKVRLAGK